MVNLIKVHPQLIWCTVLNGPFWHPDHEFIKLLEQYRLTHYTKSETEELGGVTTVS